MKATVEWFKIYKIPDGKPENKFAFDGKAIAKNSAWDVIDEVHQHWKSLIQSEAPSGDIQWFVTSTKKLYVSYRVECFYY